MDKKKKDTATIINSVFAALFAALISVTNFVALPAGALGVVPIVMQNMMAVLSGAVLGGITGAGAVLLFLTAGILGLPVFAGGTSGVVRLFGPTGGFLAGYFFGAFIAGLLSGRPRIGEKRNLILIIRISIAVITGNLVIYILGMTFLALWISRSNSIDFTAAIPGAVISGALPFIPGDVLKIFISVPLAITLRPIAARYINPNE
ncbi:MAG: biotin transporter BioY [Spirochaetaceae bacterium]|jgi:biotin transport system substrate-specific component|nr:biotin transporter BioY [Spirochaetaceae bacterium]